MPARRGSELVIRRGDGGSPETFTAIGALQNSNWSINGNPVEVTTADDVDVNGETWRTFLTGPKSGTISGNGIGKQIQPIQSLYEDVHLGRYPNCQVIVPYVGTWTAGFVVTNFEFTGPYDGVLAFTISMQLAGAPVFVKET